MCRPPAALLLLAALLTLLACEPRQHATVDAVPSSTEPDLVEFCGQRLARHVEHVTCHDPQVSDLTPLAELRGLLILNLNDTGASDLSPLAELPRLMGVDLERTRVSDIRPLTTIPTLISIRLAGSWVVDALPLAELTGLKFLDVSRTGVSLPQVVVLRHVLPDTVVTGP